MIPGVSVIPTAAFAKITSPLLLTRQLFFEASLAEGFPEIAIERRTWGESQTNVARAERLVHLSGRQRVEPMQPMRPTANNDHVSKPRADRVHKAREVGKVLH
jgi:hypothetical protein